MSELIVMVEGLVWGFLQDGSREATESEESGRPDLQDSSELRCSVPPELRRWGSRSSLAPSPGLMLFNVQAYGEQRRKREL